MHLVYCMDTWTGGVWQDFGAIIGFTSRLALRASFTCIDNLALSTDEFDRDLVLFKKTHVIWR